MKRVLLLLAFLALAAPLAHAQLVTTCSVAATAGNPTTATTSACNTPAGSFYAISVYSTNSTTITSISTLAGDTPTLIGTALVVGTSDHVSLYVVYNSAGNAANTVTVNVSNGTFGIFMNAAVYSDIHSGSFDTSASGSGGPFGTPATAAFNTATSNERVIGFCAFDNATVPAAGSGYTFRVNDASDRSWLEDQQFATVQTGISLSMTDVNHYGCVAGAWKALDAPTVTTTTAASVTSNSAVAGGVVTNNGGSAITAQGVAYGTSPNPTSPCTGSGTSSPFTTNLTGLSYNTTYYYRACATNAQGTSYGADLSFTTPYPANQGASLNLTQSGATETQIILDYTATSSAACTIVPTDLGFGAMGPSNVLFDFDPAIFTNANLDLSRTYTNGFRWPTIVTGNHRKVFLGGHDEVKQTTATGALWTWVSTAAQMASCYNVQVICNGAADIQTIVACTNNGPAASNYPEQVIPNPAAPNGGYPAQTRRWDLGQNEKINDPITGLALTSALSPVQQAAAAIAPVLETFSFAYDVNADSSDCSNHNWTSPCNAYTNEVSGTLASTSTVGAKLFLTGNLTSQVFGNQLLADIQTQPYGNATTSAAVMASCLGYSNGTCLTAELDETIPTGSAAVQTPVPATFLSGFTAWYPLAANADLGLANLTQNVLTGVSCSGSVCTLASLPSSGVYGFNVQRPAGSKFTIGSCATGANTTLTVSHSDSPTQITVTQTGLSLSNCTYTDEGFGLLVWLKSGGTLNISETYAPVVLNTTSQGSNGSETMQAISEVTDITTGCDGQPRSPAMTGWLAYIPNGNSGSIILIEDDNQICLQSVLTIPVAQGGNHNATYFTSNPSSWTSAKTMLAAARGTGDLWSITKDNSGNYTAYVPGTTLPDDRFIYTDVTSSWPSLSAQITAAGGSCATWQATGFFGGYSYQTVTSAGNVWLYAGNNAANFGLMAFVNPSGTLIGCIPTFGTYPMRWQATHFSPNCPGNLCEINLGTDAGKYNPSLNLGGPWVLYPTGAYRKNGTWTTYSLSISAATNANPVVLTSANNDLDNWSASPGGNYTGALLTCSGGTGSWAALNTMVHAIRINNNTFSLTSLANTTINSTSWGAYPGGVTCTLDPPEVSINISGVTTDPNVAGVAQVSLNPNGGNGGFIDVFPSGSTHLTDGDGVVFTGLASTAQYYVKVSCTGCSASGPMDIYHDAALTSPAPASEIAAANGGYMSNAEVCPDINSLSLPGPIYYSAGPGTGASLNVSCQWREYTGDPCSYWAGSAEASALPCASNPQTYTSTLQTLNTGDTLFDVSRPPANHEWYFVLAKDTTSHPGFTRLNIMRFYSAGFGTNSVPSDQVAYNHSPGWTPQMYKSLGSAVVNAANVSAGWTPISSVWPGTHFDFVNGPGSNYTFANSYNNAASLYNVLLSQLGTTPSTVTNGFLTWNNTAANTITSVLQSYPSCRQFGFVSSYEQTWCGNVASANVDAGNGYNAVNGSGLTQTLTAVGGTHSVFQITNIGATVNVKTNEYIALAPALFYGQDISGPGARISDSTPYTKCWPYYAGDCVSGSTAGSGWYVAAPGGGFNGGQILTNNMSVPQLAIYPASPIAGWAIQQRMTPNDLTGSGTRRLTQSFAIPTTHYYASNWRPGPPIAKGGGVWGFHPVMFGQAQWKGDALGLTWMLSRVPPYPVTDATNRTAFVNVPVKLSGVSGDNIRIAFGYGENGNPANLYCVSRQETCWTSSTATASNPFLFAGETQSKTSCSSGCTVNIPAIPGRILFYQIERSNGSNVSVSPLRAIPVP